MLQTVNEKSLELAVHGQLAAADYVRRMRERIEQEDGQGAAEYIGIILVIAAIIALLAKQGQPIANAIKDGIENAIKTVSNGD